MQLVKGLILWGLCFFVWAGSNTNETIVVDRINPEVSITVNSNPADIGADFWTQKSDF